MVGIIEPTSENNLYWRGETFQPEIANNGYTSVETLPVLASNDQIMNVLNNLSQPYIQKNNGAKFTSMPQLYWYYNFDFSHFEIDQLPTLITGLNRALTHLSSNRYYAPPSVVGTPPTGPLKALQGYTGRITVANLPITCLPFLITGLTLFFVLLMTDVLIERQVTAIALLRSRGASARQVFGALLSQGLGLSIIAFVVGPVLAILGTVALANLTLRADGVLELGPITNDPLNVARELLAPDGVVVGLALAGLILSIWRALSGNVLLLQRETARSTHKPIWIRYNLDVIAAVAALVGFGFSLYIELPGVLDIHARTLILPPISLVGIACLLVACLLFFLRFFPAILRLGERLTRRNRKAAPVLALAQMARAPRQSLRMVLLFALAVAFAFFTLIFSQTQAQRLSDLTAYQVGSDFAGEIPLILQDNAYSNQVAFYRSIKGVTSVTLGTSLNMAGGTGDVLIDVNAMDAHTYAQTMYWTAQDSSQPIDSLTEHLQRGQALAEQTKVIPAIIDDAAAQSLGVGSGQQFTLGNSLGPVTFTVVGIVHYLPTTFDSMSPSSDSTIPQGGILVDLQTFSDVEMAEYQDVVSPTNFWLRTTDQPSDLANVRAALRTGIYKADVWEDRRTLQQNLGTDPFYGAIQGIMLFGALVVLLLGLVGNLLVSWWNARSRKTSFAVLRALGCSPGQIVSVLIWEQGIVYGIGTVLGVVIGIISALAIVPVFIFSPLVSTGLNTSPATIEDFYLAQVVPGVQVAAQPLVVLALLAGLVVICMLAIFLMLSIAIGPRVSQALRLEED